MGEWGFVVAAYGLVAAVLLLYWMRVERRLRELETGRSPAQTERA
jgi:HAMP domain-containing protein